MVTEHETDWRALAERLLGALRDRHGYGDDVPCCVEQEAVAAMEAAYEAGLPRPVEPERIDDRTPEQREADRALYEKFFRFQHAMMQTHGVPRLGGKMWERE